MFQTNQEHCPQNSTDNESSMVVLAKSALKSIRLNFVGDLCHNESKQMISC